MMTTTEILKEIRNLPISERRKIKENLLEDEELIGEESSEANETKFFQELLAKGLISDIPEGITDEEDDFEPIEFEGEPVSETIIRERR